VIADLAGDDAIDNRRFYNRPDVSLVEFQNKTYLYLSIGSGFRAHPLDETIDDRFYVLRQAEWEGIPNGYGFNEGTDSEPSYSAIEEGDLFDVTDNAIAEGDDEERDDALQDLVSLQGWKLHLTMPGEKTLATSVTINYQVLFTTYMPSEASMACSISVGSGRVYALNLLDGTPSSPFDTTTETDEDVQLTAEDRHKPLIRNGIPTQPFAYFPEGETPVVMVATEVISNIDMGSMIRRKYWSEEPGF